MMLLHPGKHGVSDEGAAYQSLVLSTSPLAYWPCNDTVGTTIQDASGNGNIGTYAGTGVTLGQAGLKGKAVQVANTATDKLSGAANIIAALDMREYSCAFLVKHNTSAILNPKYLELWNEDDDYSAFELRNTNHITFHLLEPTGQQDESLGRLNPVVDGEWMLVVLFNSESTGNAGVYYNKEYTPIVRLLGGQTDHYSADNIFGMFTNFDAYVQHIVFWNRLITQAEVDALYNASIGAESSAWSGVYTINDVFTTDDAAPIASPRTCEPGPGTLTVTDADNHMSISGSKILWDGAKTDYTEPRVFGAAVAPLPGRALLGTWTGVILLTGWGEAVTASPQKVSFFPFLTYLYIYTQPTGAPEVGTITSGGTYNFALVQRRIGTMYFIKGGTQYPDWTLLLHTRQNLATFYPGLGVGSGAGSVSKFKLTDLPAPFNSNWGLATTTLLGKRADGDTFTHPTACIIELNVDVTPTSGTVDLRFRKTDATNYWQVVVGTDGSVTMNEVVAGSSTQIATNATGVARDKRLIIRSDGAAIRVFIIGVSGEADFGTTTAATGATSTDGILVDVGDGVVSDLVVWPITVPTAAATILDSALG